MAHKETDNTNNENTNLNQVRVCNHWAAPLSQDQRAKKLPSRGRADRCCLAAPRSEYHTFRRSATIQMSNPQALADLKKARPSREVTALVEAWGGCFFLLAIITAAISAVKHDRWTTFAVHLCADHPPNPKSTMENQKNDRMPFPDQDPNNA